MIKLKNLYLALKHQLPFSHLLKIIFNGRIKGLLSKRSHFRNGGNLKVKYGHEESARKAAERLMTKNGFHFSVYRCIYCDGWHIGADRHKMKNN